MYSTKHLSKQREFLVLLSAYVNQENCTREAVLNYIFEKGWILLSEEERTRRTKDNDKYSWKVSLAYARKRLVTEGCLLGQPWNQWHITRRGIEMLPFKFEEIRAIEHPEVITEKLIEDAGEIISRLILPPAKSGKKENAQSGRSAALPVIPTETEKDAVVKQRIGQGPFRNKLLRRSHTCQVCGLAQESLLRASRVKPWKASNNREKLDTDNGLLLCVLHDGLFDKGLISFSPTGNILISETLTQEDRDKLHLDEAMRRRSGKCIFSVSQGTRF